MKIAEFAAVAVEHYEDDDAPPGAAKAIDPATIGIFLELIPVLIEAVKKCMEAKAAKKAAGNPTLLQMTVLNMSARRAMGGPAFRQHGRNSVKAIVRSVASPKVEVADIEEMYQEV